MCVIATNASALSKMITQERAVLVRSALAVANLLRAVMKPIKPCDTCRVAVIMWKPEVKLCKNCEETANSNLPAPSRL